MLSITVNSYLQSLCLDIPLSVFEQISYVINNCKFLSLYLCLSRSVMLSITVNSYLQSLCLDIPLSVSGQISYVINNCKLLPSKPVFGYPSISYIINSCKF